MKKILLLILLLSVFALSVNAQECELNRVGDYTQNFCKTVEGIEVTLTVPSTNLDCGNVNWEIVVGTDTCTPEYIIYENNEPVVIEEKCEDSTNIPDDNTGDSIFESVFKTGPGLCSVNFLSYRSGIYNVRASDGSNSETFVVDVKDTLEEKGFGHTCNVVQTSNCGDVFTYGELSVLDSLSAYNLYSYGSVHVFGYATIAGNFLSTDVAILGATTVNGIITVNDLVLTGGATIFNPSGPVRISDDLEIEGELLGGPDGQLGIGSDLDISGNLVVHGGAILYQLENISNAGNPVNVRGDMIVEGDMIIDNAGYGIELGGEWRDTWPEFAEVGIENLLRNPGFESGDTTGWTVWNGAGIDYMGVVITRRVHGDYSLSLDMSAANSGLTQSIPVVNGREYTLSGWTYVDGGTAIIRVVGSDLTDIGMPATSSWEYFSASFNATSSTIGVYLGSLIANSDMYWDDLMLEEGVVATKFRPRYLNYEGEAEFKSLETLEDTYIEGSLVADGGAYIYGNAQVDGVLDVDGELTATNVNIQGDIIASLSTSRLMGAVNLRKACDSASPRMYEENGDFVIELGTPNAGQCGLDDACVSDADCDTGLNCFDGTCII